ncbi:MULTISPECIES: acyltransferase family protein [Nitrosomonas]|jgi:peptidoglycan/LPS O-acetylase OafA/YrhL|uniref:Acyltransferase 3 domain-containing protein n=1 Tax=Nitrosomonas communis TaxID=44574 RepID=A0A5D3YCR9_9PROT|nr:MULTISPECIES: acyltransferase family protein [Nitrosomonas]TYP88225.1 hypothetical protein BCL69_102110 [Nitrosomonas communis]UVS60960.1 hypothetical protein NX761_15930 [Nitrosomonas sp. PLL12]
MQAGSPRIPLIDVLKATSCLLIVSHHLAWYGPMSDYAYPLIPSLINWLSEYGRIAVQVFFVTAGFLSAKKFAPTKGYLLSLIHFISSNDVILGWSHPILLHSL